MPCNREILSALAVLSLVAALGAAGCGSSSSSSPSTSSSASQAAGGASSAAASSSGAAGALSADAHSAATGDIPDNQVFLVFEDASAGWSMKYPEGWTQSGTGSNVSFSDKNNLVHVLVGPGAAPTTASVTGQLQALKRSQPSLSFTLPKAIALTAGPAVKATYTTASRPDPVTGKRVTLIVDRYLVRHGSRVATVDLGTPRGVDNVDAYRMMINSFRWR